MKDKEKEDFKTFIVKLKEANDLKECLTIILDFVLKYYDLDSAFIIKSDNNFDVNSNVYKVFNKNKDIENSKIEKIYLSYLKDIKKLLMSDKSYFIDNMEDKDNKSKYELLKKEGINSLLAISFCKKNINGLVVGINPKKNIKDDSMLQVASYLVNNIFAEMNIFDESSFLAKNDMYVKTFGDFKIKTFLGNFNKGFLSSKCLIFFVYLLFNRDRFVTSNELTSVIWKEQELIDPYNYLKNIAFRTKKSLKNLTDEEVIVAQNGSYVFNNNIKITTDYEVMEVLYLRAKKENIDEEEKIDLYKKILKIYDGDMLDSLKEEHWAFPIINKYKCLYIDVVEKYLKILFKKKDYFSVFEITEKAIKIDSSISSFHYYTIRAYIDIGRIFIAKKYLKNIKMQLLDTQYKELYKLIEENLTKI